MEPLDFQKWLEEAKVELEQLGHWSALTSDEIIWLNQLYTYYQLSPSEAAQYVMHELLSTEE